LESLMFLHILPESRAVIYSLMILDSGPSCGGKTFF
jgi:hypothetical protein